MKSKIHENQLKSIKIMSTKIITIIALFVASLVSAQDNLNKEWVKLYKPGKKENLQKQLRN